MTQDEISKLIHGREKRTLEYKTAWSDVPSNLFETVCAFLNRDGGIIVLGAQDDGSLNGVNPASANQMCKNIANMSNNEQKLCPPFLLQPESFIVKDTDSKEPILDDDNVFKAVIPLPKELDFAINNINLILEVQKEVQKKGIFITNRQLDVLARMAINPSITRHQLSNELSISTKNVTDSISALKKLSLLKRSGGKKSGKWVVLLPNLNQ